jgi:endonuclease/exonuclease/phosphatase family metal-dependent hydrolase
MRAQYPIGGRGASAESSRAALLDREGFPAQNAWVRLATFNVKHALLAGLDAIAGALRESRADVIGLQEVDRGARRSGGVDQARALGERLGMRWAFAKAMDHDGGEYGCALLVSPALSGAALRSTAVLLPGGEGPGEEPRVLLRAQAAGLRIFVSHLDLPSAVRPAQADAIARQIGDPQGSVLLCDCNEGVAGPAVRRLLALPLRDAWTEASAPERPTAPGDRPQERIDLVLLGPGVPAARSARAIDTGASDHPLVVVEL